LIVGLGNPGPGYANTRHNVGYRVVDVLAGRMSGSFGRHRRANAETVEGRLVGHRVVLAKSRTYMNLSGSPVAALAAFYKIPVAGVIAVHDDLDLPLGVLRLKAGGGDGGHNGLKSMRGSLGSGDFQRVRVGIDRPPGRMDPADYVLKPFSAGQQPEVAVAIERAADAVECLLTDGLGGAQNLFNG
jgi:PTH1 family peptidyl-tRNA hydrolase